MITARTQEKRRELQADEDDATLRRPLTKDQNRENIVCAYDDLMDVVNFLFMPDWGCVHLRSEWFLSSKSNTKMPTSFTDEHEPCGSKCYICNEDYKESMLPIVHQGAVDFLDSNHFADSLARIVVTNADHDLIPDLLWESADWRISVFGKKTVQKYNVHSFFFQLLATKILSFEWKNNTKEVRCVRTRDESGRLLFRDRASWDGFKFRPARAQRAK